MACRLCHEQCPSISKIDIFEVKMVNFALPHIHLKMTKNPQICEKCKKILKVCYFFKHNFTHHEKNLQICTNKILNHELSTTNGKNRKYSFKYLLKRCGYELFSDDQNIICRTCFKQVDRSSCSIFDKNIQFREFLIATMFEGSLVPVSKDIFICTRCCKKFEKYNKFYLKTFKNEDYLSVFYKEYNKEPLTSKEFLLAAKREDDLLHEILLKKKNRKKIVEMEMLDESNIIQNKRTRKKTVEKNNEDDTIEIIETDETEDMSEIPDRQDLHEVNKLVPMFVDDESASDLEIKFWSEPGIAEISDESEDNIDLTQDINEEEAIEDCDTVPTISENSTIINNFNEILNESITENETNIVTLEDSSDERSIIEEIDLNSSSEESSKDPKLMKCVFCEYSTESMLVLYDHFISTHNNNTKREPSEKNICPICSFATSETHTFITHVIEQHSTEDDIPLHACSKCKYKTNFKYAIESHFKFSHQNKTNPNKFIKQHYRCYNKRRYNKNYRNTPLLASNSGTTVEKHVENGINSQLSNITDNNKKVSNQRFNRKKNNTNSKKYKISKKNSTHNRWFNSNSCITKSNSISHSETPNNFNNRSSVENQISFNNTNGNSYSNTNWTDNNIKRSHFQASSSSFTLNNYTNSEYQNSWNSFHNDSNFLSNGRTHIYF